MSGRGRPVIFVVGLGPGGRDEMTPRALRALERCDVIIGYSVYAEMAREIFPDKDVRPFAMRQEIERCRTAIEIALSGDTVGVVSGGDPGVYGMAGVMLEIAKSLGCDVDVEIVPGVTACCSAASIIGAPISNDFAVISLSDLLTPWDTIERRIGLAAEGDFVICIYNPSSGKRAGYLRRACDIALRTRSAETPAAWVRMAGRDGEESRILTLGELRDEHLDMFCTAFIGNSLTKTLGGRMVTSRGYKL
ncbi:MAG: precorrin-3B C(17)-methyltransferase [Synergistaceae bacterium]|jgi:precorrin-3B C17-methyltransferase|nr:precorrin-3B C(17)-methyltransferase [Synergistaceae bacterium]